MPSLDGMIFFFVFFFFCTEPVLFCHMVIYADAKKNTLYIIWVIPYKLKIIKVSSLNSTMGLENAGYRSDSERTRMV